jgi:hypothetical protein
MKRVMVAVAVCSALAGWLGGLGYAGVARAEQGLPENVRKALRPRMAGHGDEMEELIWSVLLLERKQTRLLAQGMGGAERVAPGTAGVPQSFFRHQDNLLDQTRQLMRAAERKEDLEVARSFGRVMETCVACHSEFLE